MELVDCVAFTELVLCRDNVINDKIRTASSKRSSIDGKNSKKRTYKLRNV